MKQPQAKIESRALYFAGGGAVLAAAIGLIVFWGRMSPLFGHGSIGSVASVTAAVAALVAFVAAYEKPAQLTQSRSKMRGALITGALGFVHGAICLLLVVVGFYLAHDAFVGVTLDQWVAAVLSGLCAAVAAYWAFLAGTGLTSLRLSTTLAVFLVSGVMASMITSDNPYWWQLHFSSLGAGHSASALAFNLTLVLAGTIIVCLADYVTLDLKRWQVARGARAARVNVNVIRGLLAAIGVLLALVGIFDYVEAFVIHTLAAGGMAILFLALIVALPWLAPGFSKPFFTFSYAMMAALLTCNWLWNGVGYLNITAFELLCGAIIFAWLVVFMRNLVQEAGTY